MLLCDIFLRLGSLKCILVELRECQNLKQWKTISNHIELSVVVMLEHNINGVTCNNCVARTQNLTMTSNPNTNCPEFLLVLTIFAFP